MLTFVDNKLSITSVSDKRRSCNFDYLLFELPVLLDLDRKQRVRQRELN